MLVFKYFFQHACDEVFSRPCLMEQIRLFGEPCPRRWDVKYMVREGCSKWLDSKNWFGRGIVPASTWGVGGVPTPCNSGYSKSFLRIFMKGTRFYDLCYPLWNLWFWPPKNHGALIIPSCRQNTSSLVQVVRLRPESVAVGTEVGQLNWHVEVGKRSPSFLPKGMQVFCITWKINNSQICCIKNIYAFVLT